MPELPEVEVVRRGLALTLKGKRIRKSALLSDRYDLDLSKVSGRTVHEVRRHGKYLFLDLGRDQLMIHLGMSGYFRLTTARDMLGEEESRHDHLGLEYDVTGRRIIYVDPRRFGRIKLLRSTEVVDLINPKDYRRGLLRFNLGPDAISWNLTSAETGQRSRFWAGLLKASARPIKLFLLDQSNVAGVGSIYADEILYHIKVHPLRPADSLSDEEITRLAVELPAMLLRAIELGGSTTKGANPYVNVAGETGTVKHFAYGQTGRICERCNRSRIKKIYLGGRATHFCPTCQPA